MSTIRDKRAQDRAAAAEKLHNTITEKVATLTNSDEWAAFCDNAAQFHTYSLRNLLLIRAQKPTATQVAGYNKWLELGRHVRPGPGSGIKIFGYSTRRTTRDNPDTGEEETVNIPTFPMVTVFDVEDTEPNTEITDTMRKKNPNAILWSQVPAHPAQNLTGDDHEGIYQRTHQFITAQGWTVQRQPIPGDTNGYATSDGTRRIVIDEHISNAQAAKTLIHESAHALMHADLEAGEYIAHRGRYEVEAESVAYIVAGMLGLDTSTYSIGYIATWAKEEPSTDLLTDTAQRVLTTARHIAAEILDNPDTEEETAA